MSGQKMIINRFKRGLSHRPAHIPAGSEKRIKPNGTKQVIAMSLKELEEEFAKIQNKTSNKPAALRRKITEIMSGPDS